MVVEAFVVSSVATSPSLKVVSPTVSSRSSRFSLVTWSVSSTTVTLTLELSTEMEAESALVEISAARAW